MAQRELRGTLGRNQKHEPGTNQPAYKGSCMLEDGREYWISGWVNESESGKFFSLAFKPKEQQPKTDARPASGSPQLQAKYGSNGPRDDHRRGVLEDEIPF